MAFQTPRSASLIEGAQSLTATVTDAYANTAVSSVRTVTLDTVLPTTTETLSGCTSGLNGWCKNASRAISFTGTDSGSGIDTRQVQNGSMTWTTYTGTLTIGQVNGYVVTYRARDIAGNDSLRT